MTPDALVGGRPPGLARQCGWPLVGGRPPGLAHCGWCWATPPDTLRLRSG